MQVVEPSSGFGLPLNDTSGGNGSSSAEAREGQDNKQQADGEMSFLEWLGKYSVGRLGPADQMPLPPPSIRAILEEEAAGTANRNGSSSADSPASTTPSSPSTAPSRSINSSPNPSIRPRRAPLSVSITLSQGSQGGSQRTSSTGSIASSNTDSLVNPAVSDETAAALLDHYRKFGTFPAPPGPWEEERLRLAHKYGLDQAMRRKAIDRICSIAKAHFKTKMVVVSLTMDDHQVLGAERGFDPNGEPTLEDPVRQLEVEPAFCTHAMASSYKDPKSVFIVGDANKDWRFKRNPYATKNGGGVSFYAAANVNFPTEGEDVGLPQTLASGALCLMDPVKTMSDPNDFTKEDREVLSDLADMIAREFQLGFEQRRREVESKQSEFLGSFLQQALVQPSRPGCLRVASSTSSSTPSNTNSPRPSPLNSMDQPEGIDSPTPSTRLDDRPFEFPPPVPSKTHTSHLSPARPPAKPLRTPSRDPRPPSTPNSPRSRWEEPPSSPRSRFEEHEDFGPSLFLTAATNLVAHTRSKSCGILDLRAFRSSFYRAEPNVLRSSVSLSPTSLNHNRFGSADAIPAFNQDARRDPRHPTQKRTESYGTGHGKVSRGKIGLMSSVGEVDWQKVVKKSTKLSNRQADAMVNAETEAEGKRVEEEPEDALVQAVEETLRMYSTMTEEEVESRGLEGAFSAFGILPETTSDTCCIPVFDVDGSPALMIVLSSTEKWFRFEPSDRRFVQSVGAIIVGSLLRERARDSDRAKLAFISQVSHELRTPLHGINSQLELIREFSSPAELRKLAPLLDVADVCLESLSDVLNDTLDFSKLSNNSAQEAASLKQRSLAQTDLAGLLEGVLKSTWVKKRRVDLATTDLESVDLRKSGGKDQKGSVDLILEVEGKEDGWEVMTDIGGMKRVLLNVVGNALKFTKTGHVRVTLRHLGSSVASSPMTPTPRARTKSSPEARTYRGYVAIVVQDTGIGMSQEFLRDGMLFTPFKQADPFAPGAGLGLSICDSIVKRLGGRIDVSSQQNVGTEIAITLPVEFVLRQTSNSFPFNFTPGDRPKNQSSRRNISEELNDLLAPGPSQVLSASTSSFSTPALSPLYTRPPLHSPALSARPPHIDFPTAVQAVSASLSSPLASPSIHQPSNAFPLAGQDDLAFEAAKLAISSTQGIGSTLLPMASPSAADDTVISVASKPTVIPVAKAEPRIVETEVDERRKSSVAPDVHVLFADDNPVARNILIKLFTGKGIKFSAAADGQQAVDLYKAAQGSISIFFADVQMPIKDGLEAAADIRQIEKERGWPPCRIVALTGLSNETEMATALGDTGSIDKWLVKGGKSLRVIIDEVVDIQREMDERKMGN